MSYDRIHSAKQALSGFTAESYAIFDREADEKYVLLWQPSGDVKNLHRFPKPENLKEKSESFLRTANQEHCELAAIPEWGLKLEWIEDYPELLVGPESPLFVLGCAPVSVDNIDSILTALEHSFDVITTYECDSDTTCRVPSSEGKLFVTPTVVPIKSSARPESDEDALLVQFKNKHMSARSNSAEQKHMSAGNGVWQLNPNRSGTKVLVWTCSDLLDKDLRDSAIDFAQTEDAIVAHVQCNPEPFHKKWDNFRIQIFETITPITYLNVNWGKLNELDSAERTIPCGYTGVFTKTDDYSTIGEGYNRTCQAGGIAGVNTENHYEYVCSVVADSVNKVRFHRINPTRSPEETAAMSDVQILSAWKFSQCEYTKCSEMPNSELPDQPAKCTEWRNKVDLDPAEGEVLDALIRGDVKIPKIDSKYNPTEQLKWNLIGSFTNNDKGGFAPLLRNHGLRKIRTTSGPSSTPSPGQIAHELISLTEFANEEQDITLKKDFGLNSTPVNATYEDRPVEIQLSILDTCFKKKEQKRAKWLYNWYQEVEREFKPVVVVEQPTDSAVLKTLEGYEDVTGTLKDPEAYDETAGLGELKT